MLVGRFNLYNIMAAAGAGVALGLPLESIKEGLEHHGQVPGRLERVENALGVTVLVDYAHTGDALENVLLTMTELKKVESSPSLVVVATGTRANVRSWARLPDATAI